MILVFMESICRYCIVVVENDGQSCIEDYRFQNFSEDGDGFYPEDGVRYQSTFL